MCRFDLMEFEVEGRARFGPDRLWSRPQSDASSSTDPNDDLVRLQVSRELNRREGSPIWNYPAFLRDSVGGRSVLDIGCVEHTAEYVKANDWEHAIVADAASTCVGIDILDEEIRVIREEYGYDLRSVDATGDSDMGVRFDVVVVGDVIEHVGDIEALLRFARRHLETGGVCLVKTPNPVFFRQVIDDARGVHVPNLDHLSWQSPATLAALAARVGLELERYWPVLPPSDTRVRQALREWLSRRGGMRNLLAASFCFELALPVEAAG